MSRLKRSYTKYTTTVEDFRRYYTNSFFFGTGKYKRQVLYTTGNVVFDECYTNRDEDEDDEDECFVTINKKDYVLSGTEDLNGEIPVEFFEVFVYPQGDVEYVTKDSLIEDKGKSFINVEYDKVIVLQYNHSDSYKKGINLKDYVYKKIPASILLSSEPPLRSDFVAGIILKSRFVTATKEDIQGLLDCKRVTLQLSNRYFAINQNNYRYPLVYSYSIPVGFINNKGKVITKLSGKVIDRYK